MKTVFGTHAQLAHVWAQQNVERGRSSDGRMFFEGPTIYSYGRHYAIAKFSIDKKGNAIVLFNSSGYSVSTSKHRTLTRRAISVPVIGVRDPERGPEFSIELIEADFAQLVKAYGATTHAGRKAKLIREMNALNAEANTIGNALIKGWRAKALPKDLTKHAAKLVAADTAKAEAAEAKRLVDIEETITQAETVLGKPRVEWAAMWRAHFTPPLTYDCNEVSAWRRAMHYLTYDRDIILLRLYRTPTEQPTLIETSRGAEFPVSAALRALPVIRRMKQQGKSWQRNGETLPLGAFQIDTIYPDGNVKAGCHLVTYDEIELIAKELGQ